MIILGNHDGYIRAYDENRKYDEGNGDEQVAIDSYCLFTPLQIASPEHQGRIIRTTIVTGGGDIGTDSMNYEIYVGDTGEDVINLENTATIAGTINGTARVQTRSRAIGQYMGAYISNNIVNESFGFEAIIIEITSGGRVK
jgi:hypothetical protein